MPKATKKASLADNLIRAGVFLLIYVVISSVLEGVVYLVYSAGYIGYNNFTFISDVATLIPLSIAVFAYAIFYKKMKPRKALTSLGFSAKGGIINKIVLGVVIFLVIFVLELVISLISVAANVSINTNVGTVFAGAPIWFYIFSATIEPINEEILFRGFLVPRLGIIASAVIFGLAHYSYYSTFGVEVIAAFIFGTIAGYVFRKTKSIYPGIVAHILVNTIAVISLIG